MRRGLIGLLLVLLLGIVGSFQTSAFSVQEKVNSTADSSYQVNYFRDQTYYRKWLSWSTEFSPISYPNTAFSLDQALQDPSSTLQISDVLGNSMTTMLLQKGQKAQYQIVVPEKGLYQIALTYRADQVFYSKPSVKILINQQVLFNEIADYPLDVVWESVELEENRRYNRYGNELNPDSVGLTTWRQMPLSDPTNATSGNFYFLLESGVNLITIEALNEAFHLGDLFVLGKPELLDYASYLDQMSFIKPSTQNQIIIEGESFFTKNDLEIKSSYHKEPAMTPYTFKNIVLNQLDGNSMTRGGLRVDYRFFVEHSGFYQLSMKVLKSQNVGVASAKNIYLDGKIPFQELSGYLFSTARHYRFETLGQEDDVFWIYLSEGFHTLSIESTIHPYVEIIDELNTIKDRINQISLLVQTITGGNKDDAVDWDIVKYIPNLKGELETFALRLRALYEEINQMDQGSKVAAEVTTLQVAAKQLERIAKIPNKIGSKLAEFSQGSGSSYQLIGNAITALLQSPVSVDSIYFHQGENLPNPRANFFVRLWDSVASFFFSFFDQRYNDFKVEEGTLEVWVGQSSLYLDLIQSMIDQDFTTQTGIKVKASILTNPSKIVLSNSTNSNPDVVLSIDSWNPYAYALRGMLTDLSKLEGFEDVSKNIVANNFTPVIFEDGVYAIPETQSVFLLFYRQDILDYLELDVPNTWQDVLAMLPILQSHQLNFFHPLGGDAAFKGYGFVSPLIYQMGGEIFTENGTQSTLKDPTTIQAIQMMTDLFTIYNLPLQVSSFFEHFRSGSMPLGISSVDFYLQLKYAAPELAGQWGVTVVPGVYNETTNEVERWQTTYGKTSILFKNSNMQEEGWAFIKWWNETQTQIKFMQQIKSSLGERYLIMGANMESLRQSVWENSLKDVLLQQAMWSRIPAVTPGSYIVERELSSIWNKVVIERQNVSVAINSSIPRINRELDRKFSEFGYLSNERPNGKEYTVPMNENIHLWIKRGYQDE